MDLSLNYTILLQIILFLVLWACLKRMLFDPMSALLAAREQRTTGTLATAASLMAEVDRARAQHAEAVHNARLGIAQQIETSRKAMQAEYERIIANARAESAAELARQRAALAQELAAVRRTLAGEADAVAGEMLRRVTGAPVS